MNDALRLTRVKLADCSCEHLLTDCFVDFLKRSNLSADEFRLLNADLKGNDALIKALNDEPQLLNTWQSVRYLQAVRRDVRLLSWLRKAQESHLSTHLIGEVNSSNRAVGCHLQSAIDGVRVKILPNPPPVYIGTELKTAKIEINGIPKNALSTFFPSTWSQDRVFEEVAEIMRNSGNQVGSNPRLYRGIASDGTNIEIRLTGSDINNLKFDTVFPY